MKVTITGKVVTRIDGPKQIYIILDDGEDAIAAKFWGRTMSEASGVVSGQTVRVEARLMSRQWNGRWYTDVDVLKLVVTHDGVARDGQTTMATVVPASPAPAPADDSDIPF